MKKVCLLLFLSCTVHCSFSQVPYVAGQQAPDFTATDYNGNVHNLYTYCRQGKYVLLDFFSYWCTTCLQTSHNIDDFYHKYGCNQSNVIVLGNESDPNGTLDQLILFISHSGGNIDDTYPQWAGSTGGSPIADLYVIMAYPTVMLVGPDSTFISVKVWPLTSISSIEDAFPAGVLNPMPCSNGIHDNEGILSWTIFPNPSATDFMINYTARFQGDAVFQIMDIAGSTVMERTVTINPGTHKLRVDVNHLSGGVYVVRVYSHENMLIYSKLVKL